MTTPGEVDAAMRCSWAGTDELYVDYHDTEWGVVLHGDDALFERLCLEGFQSGLSWLTILRKRPAFRAAFSNFRMADIAEFGQADVDRLMGDVGIVRNRRKIEAAIANARVAIEMPRALDELLWSFAPTGSPARPRSVQDIPAVTTESTAMARELKRQGFRFVGPTTCYALMQATGMVDDHLEECFRSQR